MRKVISVRLKEDVLREIDEKCQTLGVDSRTEFIKKALEYFVQSKKKF